MTLEFNNNVFILYNNVLKYYIKMNDKTIYNIINGDVIEKRYYIEYIKITHQYGRIDEYYLDYCNLHNIDNYAFKYNNLVYYYINGQFLNYEDWLVKSKHLKRKDKLKEIIKK